MKLKKLIQNSIHNYLNEQKFINDNFWKWFGTSKVKDGDNPLIVYHGSYSDFNVFKPSTHTSRHGGDDQIEGMYFTDNKDGSLFFSPSDNEKYLKPVFLSIKNPYFSTNYRDLKKELGIENLREVNKILKNMGYDGLIVENGFYANGGPYKLFLAFYPNQIKSIKNDGSWDIDDDNIYS